MFFRKMIQKTRLLKFIIYIINNSYNKKAQILQIYIMMILQVQFYKYHNGKIIKIKMIINIFYKISNNKNSN